MRYLVTLLVFLLGDPAGASNLALHGVAIGGASIPTVTPDASWAGTTSCTGSSPPTENGVLNGSGYAQKVVVGIDRPPYAWADTADWPIVISAFNLDPANAGISNVQVWLECATANITAQTTSAATGEYGYQAKLNAGATQNGEARFYVTVTPVNGYQRVYGPVVFTLNNSSDSSKQITRPNYYVDVTPGGAGNDPATCTGTGSTQGTVGAPWKTLTQATVCAAQQTTSGTGAPSATGGGIVNITCSAPPCTVVDDGAPTPGGQKINNARELQVQSQSGNRADVKFTRTSRSSNLGTWQFWAYKMRFKNTVFEGSAFKAFGCPGGAGASTNVVFENTPIIDSNGVTGPSVPNASGTTPNGYWSSDVSQFVFPLNTGCRWSQINTAGNVNYVWTGLQMMQNVTASFAFDFSAMGGPLGNGVQQSNNTFLSKVTATQTDQFKIRYFSPATATIATITNNSPVAGQATLTWTGNPALTVNAGQPSMYVEMTSGPCSGEANKFTLVSETATQSVISPGACPISSLAIGQSGFPWILAHADCMQIIGQLRSSNGVNADPNIENVLYKQYRCLGFSIQKVFYQALNNLNFIGAGTVSTGGTGNKTLTADSYTPSAVSAYTAPASATITGTTNLSPGIRLTVASTAAFTTNMPVVVAGVNGTVAANGAWKVTVFDSTHLDLQGATFDSAWTSGGTVTFTATVTGTANVSGVRLTVNSTTGITNGGGVVVASVAGTSGANGSWVGNVVDATHIDLVGSTWNSAWTSGGTVKFDTTIITIPTGTLNAIASGSGYFPRWAPGGTSPLAGSFFTITALNNTLHQEAVTGDASNLCGGGACTGVTLKSPFETIPNNFVQISSTTGQYEYARIETVASLDATTATLANAFPSGAISGAVMYVMVRSFTDVICVACVITNADVGLVGQIQNGTKNVGWIQSTIYGDCVNWRNATKFGTEDFNVYDSVIECVGSDAGPTGFPGQNAVGQTWSNNVFKSLTGVAATVLTTGTGTMGQNSVVSTLTVDNNTGKPTGGTLAGNTIGHTPRFPFDAANVAVTSSSLVGGIQP